MLLFALTQKVTKKVPLCFLLFLMESANHFVRFQDWTFAHLIFIFFKGMSETPSSFFAKKSKIHS